jgi:iron complex transport system ATP-binding protein
MNTVLEAAQVSMAVGHATLLNRVDLRIHSGETLAIVGPNGAGKSTLLRLLSADLMPSAGTVRLQGRDLRAYAPARLALLRAMLSQHVTVSFPFTVHEVVGMGCGGKANAASRALVDAAIDEVGLNALRDRELPTLSGGEQQRAHLARVLVQLACGERAHGPGILLLDEPTSSLDLRHQIALVEIARHRARNGTAVVAVLHDLYLAVRFADRILVLHRGKVAAEGTPDEAISSAIVRRTFEIEVAVQRTTEGLPFILPQSMRQVSSPPAAHL